MRTIGSWLVAIVVSVVIVGISMIGHRLGWCNCDDRANISTNETHGVKSVVVPFMANPVHNWHPANVNHIYRH